MSATSLPFASERRMLLAVLVALAGVAWVLVFWQAANMGGSEMDMPMGPGVDLTMGMTAPLFLAMWTVMMVAMMFPASAPMISAFARSQASKRDRGARGVPTWLFVAPYVALWSLFGLIGYWIAIAVGYVADDSVWVEGNISRVAGGLLVAAGAYQLTPLKRVCLARCRSPLSFMLSYWRDGRWGAVSMGLRHGAFCVGCCWMLFLLLLPLGVMNIGAMLVVTALVFAEKALPRGDSVAKLAAVMLIGYGLLAIAVPDALPTTV